jgi:hypothetical protein
MKLCQHLPQLIGGTFTAYYKMKTDAVISLILGAADSVLVGCFLVVVIVGPWLLMLFTSMAMYTMYSYRSITDRRLIRLMMKKVPSHKYGNGHDNTHEYHQHNMGATRKMALMLTVTALDFHNPP